MAERGTVEPQLDGDLRRIRSGGDLGFLYHSCHDLNRLSSYHPTFHVWRPATLLLAINIAYRSEEFVATQSSIAREVIDTIIPDEPSLGRL